jgi:hypothetical protein
VRPTAERACAMAGLSGGAKISESRKNYSSGVVAEAIAALGGSRANPSPSLGAPDYPPVLHIEGARDDHFSRGTVRRESLFGQVHQPVEVSARPPVDLTVIAFVSPAYCRARRCGSGL